MTRKPDLPPAAVRSVLHRAFGRAVPVDFARAVDGVSTQVYRVKRGTQTFYLRIAEHPDENLETDAILHQHLRDLGISVAQVVYVEPGAMSLDRSLMITTEVPGVPLAALDTLEDARAAVAAAGEDLARLNRIAVDGFGWVERHGAGWPLRAEYDAYPPFLVSYLPDPWPGRLAALLPTPILAAVAEMIEQECRHPPHRARLAHGDFDTTAVFCADGRYTGLIDFGEIRGAEPTFDLGHFCLQDEQFVLLPALVVGYQRIEPLPEDHRRTILRSAVLLGLRQLCRWFGPTHRYAPDHPAVVHRARRIADLVGLHGRGTW
ncbi:phosphotransferase family protein [Catellatospora sichuanensis]|uniref:phosphotransferase family protein n=1 Tax=Catellatospora sichuanensis TaxID=1969805 RepID=UPI001183FB3D|nr:phosphotransferase [Catellatospora sichuanensis]